MNETDKDKFEKCIKALFAAFNQECTLASLSGYWMGLSDLSIEQIQKAVAIAIRSTRFVAKPYELRDMLGLVVDHEARAIDAWGDVQRALPIGPYKSVDFDDKLINATIRNLGGWPNFVARFTDSEQEEFARHAFLKTYKNLAHGYVNGDACNPLPGISQISLVAGEVVGPKRITCSPDRFMIEMQKAPTIPLLTRAISNE